MVGMECKSDERYQKRRVESIRNNLIENLFFCSLMTLLSVTRWYRQPSDSNGTVLLHIFFLVYAQQIPLRGGTTQ